MLVSDVMCGDPVSVSPNESVALASRLMSRYNVGSLPVTERNGRLVGILTDRDVVLRCVAIGMAPEDLTVAEAMSRSVITVSPTDDVARAMDRMAVAQVRRIPVTDDERLVGIVSLGDLAQLTLCSTEAANALAEISANIERR